MAIRSSVVSLKIAMSKGSENNNKCVAAPRSALELEGVRWSSRVVRWSSRVVRWSSRECVGAAGSALELQGSALECVAAPG